MAKELVQCCKQEQLHKRQRVQEDHGMCFRLRAKQAGLNVRGYRKHVLSKEAPHAVAQDVGHNLQ